MKLQLTVSDEVLHLQSTAVSKDGSSNGNKLLFWAWLMWGFSWKQHADELVEKETFFFASVHFMWPEHVVTQRSDRSGLRQQD